jgi:hypothetical protein
MGEHFPDFGVFHVGWKVFLLLRSLWLTTRQRLGEGFLLINSNSLFVAAAMVEEE